MRQTRRERIIEYLKTQEKELRANDLISVYRHTSTSDAPALTEFFLGCGLDPLKYLKTVPPQYADGIQNYYNDRVLNLPSHINFIDWWAFRDINAKEIYIPSSVVLIRDEAFSIVDLEKVYIDGCPRVTKDAFYDCTFIKSIKINCSEEEWYKQNPEMIEDFEKDWPKAFRDSPNANLEFLK